MNLSELVEYIEDTYQLKPQNKWVFSPNASVVILPESEEWIAYLLYQFDESTGEENSLVDIKCGREEFSSGKYPFLTLPNRMKGDKWVGVNLASSERDVVLALFDKAIYLSKHPEEFLVVLEERNPARNEEGKVYHDSPILLDSKEEADRLQARGMIRKMMELYHFEDSGFLAKCKNFYRQGKFMENFEDDYPNWSLDIKKYYVTYHDLNMVELRGYFSWRTLVRKGEYKKASDSFAYLYLYELFNGIGNLSGQDGYEKILSFQKGYADVYGNEMMQRHIKEWLFDYGILNNLDEEVTKLYQSKEEAEWDKSLLVLKDPSSYKEDDVFLSLLSLPIDKKEKEFLLSKKEKAAPFFYYFYSQLMKESVENGNTFFVQLFSSPVTMNYYPFHDAVHYLEKQNDRAYSISEVRSYILRKGLWFVRQYAKELLNRNKLNQFIHGCHYYFRVYYTLGHYLKKKEEESWLAPVYDSYLEKKKKEEQEKKKIKIDFSSLEKIREDAAITRDSLLTESEIEEETPKEEEKKSEEKEQTNIYLVILQKLLYGEEVTSLLKENHLLPSLVTDTINEMLLDEVGDSVLECDGKNISVIRDYEEDIKRYLGGNHHE